MNLSKLSGLVLSATVALTCVQATAQQIDTPTRQRATQPTTQPITPAVWRGDAAPIHQITNLGRAGNISAADRFNAYRRTSKRCAATGSGKRVILTGFGLFEGIDFNVSGAMISNFANPAVWPSSVQTASDITVIDSSLANSITTGQLEISDAGVRIINRSVEIDGAPYNICLIVVDVLWDFAASVIANEMIRFQPDLVVMSGRNFGPSILEGGALNMASSLPGFSTTGEVTSTNRPLQRSILRKEVPELPTTWNNLELGRAIAPLLTSMNHELQIPNRARRDNDYICNNVTYAALQAQKGTELRLAGGRIQLRPTPLPHAQIGFLHFPDNAGVAPSEVAGWARAYAILIKTALQK